MQCHRNTGRDFICTGCYSFKSSSLCATLDTVHSLIRNCLLLLCLPTSMYCSSQSLVHLQRKFHVIKMYFIHFWFFSKRRTLSCFHYWNSPTAICSALLRTNMVNCLLIWSMQGALRPHKSQSALSLVYFPLLSLSYIHSVPFHTVLCRPVWEYVLSEGQN